MIECMKKRTKEETTPIPKIYQETLCVIATDESEEVATVEVLYVTMKMRYLLVVCIYERERERSVQGHGQSILHHPLPPLFNVLIEPAKQLIVMDLTFQTRRGGML